jgi:TonB family protein
MKRFLFISAFFHMSLLVLLFSWEVPLASRVLPRNIIEVFLFEGVVKEKLEEKNLPKVNPAPPKVREKINLQKISRVALTNSEENKKNQIQEKTEAKQFEDKEEKKPVAENASSEERALRTNGEDPLRAQAKFAAQMAEGGEGKELASPEAIPQISAGRGDLGAVFLASIGAGPEREGIQPGEGEKGPGPAKEKGPAPSSRIQTSPQDGDSILSEILSRIEGAKQYPKSARRMHMEGKATVRFKIKADGKVDSVELVESSGSEILDQASLETVRRAVPLPFKEGWLKVGIVFKIH